MFVLARGVTPSIHWIKKPEILFGKGRNRATGCFRRQLSGRLLPTGKSFWLPPFRHMTALDENTGEEIWDSGKYSCRESIGISANDNLVFIKNMMEGKCRRIFHYQSKPGTGLGMQSRSGIRNRPVSPRRIREVLVYPNHFWCSRGHRHKDTPDSLETQNLQCPDQFGTTDRKRKNSGKYDGWAGCFAFSVE